MERAAELLASGEGRISDVGARCGFQEMSYFARTFRELKGRTPSRYQAEARAFRKNLSDDASDTPEG